MIRVCSLLNVIDQYCTCHESAHPEPAAGATSCIFSSLGLLQTFLILLLSGAVFYV